MSLRQQRREHFIRKLLVNTQITHAHQGNTEINLARLDTKTTIKKAVYFQDWPHTMGIRGLTEPDVKEAIKKDNLYEQ